MKNNLKPFIIGGKLYMLPFNNDNENKNSYDCIITLIIIFIVLFIICLI